MLGGGGMLEQSSAVFGGGGTADEDLSAVTGGGGTIEHDGSAVTGGGGIAEHDGSAVTGGGGIIEQDGSAVSGGGGITEQVGSAVTGGGGILEQDKAVDGGGGITDPPSPGDTIDAERSELSAPGHEYFRTSVNASPSASPESSASHASDPIPLMVRPPARFRNPPFQISAGRSGVQMTMRVRSPRNRSRANSSGSPERP
jgi:hypothetical protein